MGESEECEHLFSNSGGYKSASDSESKFNNT